MRYLLDSNVLISLLRPRSALKILEKLEQLAEDEAVVCAIVRTELMVGALRSREPEKAVAKVIELLEDFESLPFDDHAADHAGGVRADLEAKGTIIGPNDLLIAGIALSRDLTVVTHNVSEFGRVSGLRIEDWESASA